MCEECPDWVKQACIKRTPDAAVVQKDDRELEYLKRLLMGG